MLVKKFLVVNAPNDCRAMLRDSKIASRFEVPKESAFANKLGSEKVLYGSDYPLRLYPRKQEKPDFSTFLAEIQDAGLTESEQKNILGDNASRLFGLEQ